MRIPAYDPLQLANSFSQTAAPKKKAARRRLFVVVPGLSRLNGRQACAGRTTCP